MVRQVDHLVLKPALGAQPADWIEVIQVADLNCTEAHECEDLGRRRRRRRLLSTSASDADDAAQHTTGTGKSAAPSWQLASWEQAIEQEARKLETAGQPAAAAAAVRRTSPKRHPRAAARDVHLARMGKKKTEAEGEDAGSAKPANGANAVGLSWRKLVGRADAQAHKEHVEAAKAAQADLQGEEKAMAGEIAMEVRSKMARAAKQQQQRDARLKRMAEELVEKERVEEALRASQEQRAELYKAEDDKRAKMAALKKAVAREQRKAAMLEEVEKEEEQQEDEATLVEMKIYVSKEDDLGEVRKAVIEAVESGAIDQELAKHQVEGSGPLPVKVGLWRSVQGYDAAGQCVLDCHQACGAFPRPPCEPRAIIDNAFVGETSLEHFSPDDAVELMAGMAGPHLSDMGEGKDDFKMLYTYDGREPHCGRLKCNMLECSFVAVGSVYTEPVRMEEMLSTLVPNHLPLTIKFKSVACDGKNRLSSAGTPTPRPMAW